MSEEIEVTINVTGEEAVKILNAKEQEITYLKNEIARLSQQTQYSEPQLTIPKSIAESEWMKHLILCSGITQFEFERYQFLGKEEERFLKWVNTGKNEYILYIYLAGKGLGVDLVKVVEG